MLPTNMFTALGSIRSLIKLGTIKTDNTIFKLHYQATCLLMVAFSIIVSTNQFFGTNISCFTTRGEIPTEVLNNFCWIHSTFTLPKKTSNVAYPGIDKATSADEKVYHAYYQWVCFYLFYLAIAFYLPRFLWKSMEGGKIKSLLLGLDNPILEDDNARCSKIQLVARFLEATNGHHRMYAAGYYVCEIVNFVNVILQMFLTDAFLGGEFTTYGTEVIRFSRMDDSNRTDPFVEIFPRVTKCGFRQYGPTGDIQNHDALCVLPVNIINEKVFIFIWFWFIILACLSGIVILYRIPLIISKGMRVRVIISHNRYTKHEELRAVISRSSYGDYFLLQILSKNISSLHYSELIHELYELLKSVRLSYIANSDDNLVKAVNMKSVDIN